MTGIPERGEKEHYTSSEVEHIVARRMAEQQIIQLQNGQLETNKRIVEMVTGFNAKLELMFNSLEKHPEKMEKCRDEIFTEIDKDFPTKLHLATMENHLRVQIEAVNKKVDMQWLKITIPVSIVVAASSVVGWIITYGMIVSKMAGN